MQAEIYNYPDFIAGHNSIGSVLKCGGITAAAVAVGVFDGVHLGHRELIGHLKNIADGFSGITAVLTFDPHPRAVLFPEDPPELLVPLEERTALLKEAGADMVLVAKFTPEFAMQKPEHFLDAVFEPRTGAVRAVGVGSNWRFGCRASGNAEVLAKWCSAHSMICTAVPEKRIDGEVVSSSSVRRAVASGNLELAGKLLGRSYVLCGHVVKGFQLAGTVLERPTANIEVCDGVMPPDGVYAGYVELEGKNRKYAAAVNIGFAPTFKYEKAKRRIEAHLLDFSGDLYDRKIRLTVLKYLRSERSFGSADALKMQIEKDVEEICRTIRNII